MKNWIINFIIIFATINAKGQSFPEGIAYQAQLRDGNGDFIINQTVTLKFNLIFVSTNNIAWEETHNVSTDNIGHIDLIIGQGSSTGQCFYTLFSDIDWGLNDYKIEILLDENNSGNYVSLITQNLLSVPYAYHSKTTSQKFKLSELIDVDTTNIQIGDVLVWNGTKWIAQTDTFTINQDSVTYSSYSDSSNYSTNTGYAYNCIAPTLVDSSNYAYHSDTSNFSFNSLHTLNADSSVYSDTANIALFSLGNWGLNGNNISSSNFIGTTNATDLNFRTNNINQMTIKANGQIGIGTTTPLTDFHVNNVDGMLFTGTFGTGTIPTQGPGTRLMWYPSKGSFRVGRVTSNTWDDINIGDYSFSAGYNTKASGQYSTAFGNGSFALGDNSFAVGNIANASGTSSFAAGHNPTATGAYSIALGRGGVASDTSAIAIGYHPTASGKYSVCFSNYGTASGVNSYAMGYHARSIHDGTFVYADKSTEIYLESTAANQFMVRAAGGTIFYTSSDLSTGVVLAPGSGSWSILSDSTKKENIVLAKENKYLKKLDSIEVYSWNYKSQPDSVTHIGPMAQDFYNVFGFGTDPTTINSGDFDGINLVLLKGLNEKIKTIENQNEKIILLEQELAELKQQRIELERLLLKIEAKLEQR